jgi:hypothetical protein
MRIPFGYAHVLLGFTGPAVPRGAAMTFGVFNELDLSPSDISLAVDTEFNAELRPRFLNTVTLSAIRVKLGPNVSGALHTRAVSRTGAIAVGAASPQVAKLVRKTSAEGGRWSQGRMYWPGVGETTIDQAGIIDPATLSADQTALTAFRLDLAAAGLPLQIFHATTSSSDRVPTPVNGLILDATVATQRRRLRR